MKNLLSILFILIISVPYAMLATFGTAYVMEKYFPNMSASLEIFCCFLFSALTTVIMYGVVDTYLIPFDDKEKL